MLAALLLAAPAAASERHPTLARAREPAHVPDLRGRDARPVGLACRKQIKADIQRRIAAGRDQEPDQGRARRSSGDSGSWPRRRGTGSTCSPGRCLSSGIVAGAGIMGLLAWRWTRVREPEPSPQQFALNGHPLGPEEERRLDEELARFDG